MFEPRFTTEGSAVVWFAWKTNDIISLSFGERSFPCGMRNLNVTEAPNLILRCEGGDHFFEMKNWRGAGGDGYLPGMQKDIVKLQSRANGYLIVTSINPKLQTEPNFAYLLTRLTGLQTDARQDYRFMTEGLDGKELEFWIAGWPLLRSLATYPLRG